MEAVTRTLTEWRLERYAPTFDALGYDDLPWLKMLSAVGLGEVTRAVGMKTGHAAKFLSYMQRLASGVPPGSAPQLPAQAPAPAPAAALQYTPRQQPQLKPSTAIVPVAERMAMAQLLIQAIGEGVTLRDDLVDYVDRHEAQLDCRCDRAAVVQRLWRMVAANKVERRDDNYTLQGVEAAAQAAVGAA